LTLEAKCAQRAWCARLPGMSARKKVRVGVSFDPVLAEQLATSATRLKELGVNRSEVVNAILAEFFEGSGTTESVWEAVSRRR